MIAAGWYPDPEDAASLRWRDGNAWTEHRHPAHGAPAPEEEVLLRYQMDDKERSEVTLTFERITFGRDSFAYAEIDSVEWLVTRSQKGGGTYFTLEVRAGGRKRAFTLVATRTNTKQAEYADVFGAITDALDRLVCPRLAQTMAARLRAGETITLGGALNKVELTGAGFRQKRRGAELVTWDRVAGAVSDREGGHVLFEVWTGQDRSVRPTPDVPLTGTDVVVLPHLVPLLTGSPG